MLKCLVAVVPWF